jgi:hypothetical protein
MMLSLSWIKMADGTGHPPKLRITFPFSNVECDVCELEQARHRLDWSSDVYIITVNNQVMGSYDELVHFATQDRFRNVDFLEVRLIPYVEGG